MANLDDKAAVKEDIVKPEELLPEPEMKWPWVIKLRKPIAAHGEMIDRLSFREPTANDIERCGNPIKVTFRVDGTFDVDVIEPKMSAMIGNLAAVPPSTIKQISPAQWHAIAMTLTRFFMPDWGEEIPTSA